MSIEYLVTFDNRITFAEAARMVGKSPSCVFRWATDGVAGVKLAHARLGKRMFTSKDAMTKFMNEVAEARDGAAA
jgi:hypothetical protein